MQARAAIGAQNVLAVGTVVGKSRPVLSVEEVSGDVVDHDVVAEVNGLDNRLWSETDPGEPPRSLTQTRVWLTERWRSFEHRRWLARVDGELCGVARVDVHVADPTDPTVSASIRVAARHRRHGVGRALLRAVVDDAIARRRSTLSLETTDRIPAGERFAAAVGAEPKLVQRESECDLRRVDMAMVSRWVAVPASVTSEYELWRSTQPYPENSFAAIAALQNVMNDQPFDDLDRRDVRFTAEHVAHGEAQRDWSTGGRWTHFIRHRPTGELVGYTRLYLPAAWPGMAEQGDTGVDPAHRGRGLGKWLKGSMVQSLRDERAGTRIRTTNAFTNGPMVAINDALGFKVIRTLTDWQAPTADIDRWLA